MAILRRRARFRRRWSVAQGGYGYIYQFDNDGLSVAHVGLRVYTTQCIRNDLLDTAIKSSISEICVVGIIQPPAKRHSLETQITTSDQEIEGNHEVDDQSILQ